MKIRDIVHKCEKFHLIPWVDNSGTRVKNVEFLWKIYQSWILVECWNLFLLQNTIVKLHSPKDSLGWFPLSCQIIHDVYFGYNCDINKNCMFQWSLIHGRWLQHDLWVVSHDLHDLTSYGLFHMMAPFIVEQDFLEYFQSFYSIWQLALCSVHSK